MDSNEIRNILIEKLFEITGVRIEDCNVNFLSGNVGLPIEFFLYLITELEDEYKWPITEILQENPYTVFTVNNLTQKIFGKTKSCINN